MRFKAQHSALLLIPFIFTFAFALDVYIPAVPAIADNFKTNQGIIQLTLSLFVLITGLGQLFFGPFSDHFGRRRSILISILVFILGSTLGAISFSVTMLIAARIIQALGCCGMIVTAFSIVKDLFSENESPKIYSYLNCGFSISPLFAPIIGSYLANWFNWRAEFIFLMILGIGLLCHSLIFVKETLPQDQRSKFDIKIFSSYRAILRNPIFIVYAFCASVSMVIFFIFFSVSPYIIINLLHYPVKYFGYFFACMGCTFFIGGLISSKIITRIGILDTMLFSIAIMFTSGLAMLIWRQFTGINIYDFIIPSMFTGIGCAIMLSAGTVGAMQSVMMPSGITAAVLGCLQFSLASLAGLTVMHWPVKSSQPFAGVIVTLSILTFMIFINYRKRYKTKSYKIMV